MIIILLPAYNEEKSLSSLMEKMQKFFKSFNENYKIIVCNDGSVDQTQEILEKYQKIIPIEIIQHPVNRGLAETVRDLFERAVQITNKDDIILRLDCDDTHEPKFLINIIDKSCQTSRDYSPTGRRVTAQTTEQERILQKYADKKKGGKTKKNKSKQNKSKKIKTK